jgi:hypothetical protein
MTSVISGTGTAYLSGTPEFTLNWHKINKLNNSKINCALVEKLRWLYPINKLLRWQP